MAKCVVCGKDITDPYHWASAYEELEGRSYCSIECIQVDNSVIAKQKRNKFMLETWAFLRSSLMEAIDLLEHNIEDEEYLGMYPKIRDKVYDFSKQIVKDYGKE